MATDQVSEPNEPELAARGRADEKDRVAYGQRRINLVWEITQAAIAIMVTGDVLFVSTWLVVNNHGDTAFVLLAGLANLVIAFYFQRTNHTRTGGVGDRPPEDR